MFPHPAVCRIRIFFIGIHPLSLERAPRHHPVSFQRDPCRAAVTRRSRASPCPLASAAHTDFMPDCTRRNWNPATTCTVASRGKRFHEVESRKSAHSSRIGRTAIVSVSDFDASEPEGRRVPFPLALPRSLALALSRTSARTRTPIRAPGLPCLHGSGGRGRGTRREDEHAGREGGMGASRPACRWGIAETRFAPD